MKTLQISIIIILIFSTSLYLKPIQADNANGVEIQNIQVQPATIKVGDIFTVNVILVNNLQNAIYVNVSPCRNTISVHFDSHVTVDAKNVVCEDIFSTHNVNSGENFTIDYPDYSNDFRAVTTGTTNATVILYYFEKDPTNGHIQFNSPKTISKSFLFTILDSNTGTKIIHETSSCYGYGCGYNSTLLNAPLQEKQLEDLQQAKNLNNTIILSEVGLPIAAGISVCMFLFTRKRK